MGHVPALSRVTVRCGAEVLAAQGVPFTASLANHFGEDAMQWCVQCITGIQRGYAMGKFAAAGGKVVGSDVGGAHGLVPCVGSGRWPATHLLVRRS